MKEHELIKDWLIVPEMDIVIESEFESQFLQKAVQISLNKDILDKQFKKDMGRIKIGYYKISLKARKKLIELGYLV
jgi:hypothetical protein